MITEFAVFSKCNPNQEAANAAAKVLTKQEGMDHMYQGCLVEDSTVAYWVLEWESLELHQKFGSSEAFGPFVADILSQAGEPESMVHIDFEPPSNLTMAFGAPVTEFAIVTLKSAEDREKLEGILQMIHASIALTKGAVASIHGVAMEKPNQYVHVCGWESIEDHKAALLSNDTQDLLKQINAIADADIKHAKMELKA